MVLALIVLPHVPTAVALTLIVTVHMPFTLPLVGAATLIPFNEIELPDPVNDGELPQPLKFAVEDATDMFEFKLYESAMLLIADDVGLLITK